MFILPCLFLKTMSWKMLRKSISFRFIGIEGCVNVLNGFLKRENAEILQTFYQNEANL